MIAWCWTLRSTRRSTLGAERIVIVISTAKVAIQAYLAGQGLSGDRDGVSPAMPGRTARRSSTSFRTALLGWGTPCTAARISCCRVPLPCFCRTTSSWVRTVLPKWRRTTRKGTWSPRCRSNPKDASQYGIFRLGGLPKDNCLPVSGMVEKPTPGTAPSSFAAVGRYILDPMIFDVLENTPSGKGGEIQLTDAISISGRAVPVVAFRFSGTRHDCGNHDGLLAASVARKAEARQESAIAGLCDSAFRYLCRLGTCYTCCIGS